MTESGYAASLEIDTVIMAAAGGVELAAGAAAIWPLIIPSPDRFSPSASRPARRPTVRHLRVGQIARGGERRQLGHMKDLVAVRVADPRAHLLVGDEVSNISLSEVERGWLVAPPVAPSDEV
jgi:hypothetical protein